MRKRRKILFPILMGILVILVGLAAAAAAVFDNGLFEVVINGEREIILEYGSAYEEKGAFSRYDSAVYGSVITDESVDAEGYVDVSRLGTYELTYRSRYFWHSVSAVRKVKIVDTQKPTIVLIHNSDTFTLPGAEYEEEGFRAEDNYDGDITANVVRRVEQDRVIYTVADSSGNTTEAVRYIKYGDFTPPELTLQGEASITIQAGTAYTEPGYTAIDNVDGDITGLVQVTGTVDMYQPGTYTILYTVTDQYGNTAENTRTVTVEPFKQPDSPVIEGKNVIYLTFDDGPGPYTEKLLEILGRYNVKATFFVVNSSYLHVLPKITAAGHSVAIHSYSHRYNEIYASEAAFFSDLHKMEGIIYDYTGVKTKLMRFPGGSSNGVSKFNPGIMSRLTKAVEAQGYRYFDWNVDSNDAGGAKTPEEVYQNVVAGVQGKKYAVVLQHDIHSFSVEAVERIIQWGLANAYVFLPLDTDSYSSHHTVRN